MRLSPISNMARIGGLAFTGLFVALIVDYLATPGLISLAKPFGEEAGASTAPRPGGSRQPAAHREA